ncbi:MAG TPA: mannose-6-phosphate isomerase, class I [Aldersonia sp.]
MRRLQGAVRTYAWGSRTALAQLCGRPSPSAHPEAELWFGAHPADPAMVLDDDGAARSLLTVIHDDPETELGPGKPPRLPFLVKLLAADEPLSLQAHPSRQQAREGFARENLARLPIDSPIRNYRDDNPKPELIVALEPFDALTGFRDPHRTVELLRALDVPALDSYVDMIAGQPDASGLRALFTTWITLPQPAVSALLEHVLAGCMRYVSGTDRRFVAEVRTALELGETYPEDAGVLASLLLNRVRLQPGEALYLDAGNLHAYLHGLGVEVMANSDNVLRGGLTPKHVDVPELLRVLDFRPADMPVLLPERIGDGEATRYRTPAREFAVSRVELGEADSAGLPVAGPSIVLCTSGAASVSCSHADGGAVSLTLEPGAAAWFSAGDRDARTKATAAGTVLFCVSEPAELER